jgi:hypothetical protein
MNENEFDEPWKFVNDGHSLEIEDRVGSTIVFEYDYDNEDAQCYDRIVACVNACRGIPTEKLVDLTEQGFRLNVEAIEVWPI